MFLAKGNSEQTYTLNTYDAEWYYGHGYQTLVFSLFGRFCGEQNNRRVYPNLTSEQHTSLIPAIEATIRALDELDWMPKDE